MSTSVQIRRNEYTGLLYSDPGPRVATAGTSYSTLFFQAQPNECGILFAEMAVTVGINTGGTVFASLAKSGWSRYLNHTFAGAGSITLTGFIEIPFSEPPDVIYFQLSTTAGTATATNINIAWRVLVLRQDGHPIQAVGDV